MEHQLIIKIRVATNSARKQVLKREDSAESFWTYGYPSVPR